MTMKTYVLGNWKSNGTAAALRAFGQQFAQQAPALAADTVTGIAPPAHLFHAGDTLGHAWLGAQNVSRFPAGAYTGELTADMLADAGCRFCLVGHSERRQYFAENEEDTAAKLEKLLSAGVLPVLCIGETLEQRKAGQLEAVLGQQLSALAAIDVNAELVVAYEPVWAIGTGVAATVADVDQAHTLIKDLLKAGGRNATAVLYGGSVKPGNAGELGVLPLVDGFLVGGASLKAADFSGILSAFQDAKK